MDARTKKAARRSGLARARLLWWATACAAVTELQRTGTALLAEPGGDPDGDPADRTAIADAVTALIGASEELASACPRLALFPDLLG